MGKGGVRGGLRKVHVLSGAGVGWYHMAINQQSIGVFASTVTSGLFTVLPRG